ncbi:hypothetical protein GIB67_022901 [Kingdonia uniflora]|uniref:Uncharacterized protein n=1 Tax=Kingdonia uniflora TaxID=39325 RepID=A0A7J7PC36_9MAGN|nr:hypothetical protein GIB67_022901 [Kingdonia uniflora]
MATVMQKIKDIEDEEENRTQLFFECHFSNFIWSTILQSVGFHRAAWGWDDELYFLIHSRMDTSFKELLKVAFTAFIYMIWEERNNRQIKGVGVFFVFIAFTMFFPVMVLMPQKFAIYFTLGWKDSEHNEKETGVYNGVKGVNIVMGHC